jgi:carboxypeptidase C (cathepsin A)
MPLSGPIRTFALGIALLVSPSGARADAPATKPATQEREKEKEKESPNKDDQLSVTEHELKIKGGSLKYRATAGTLNVKDEGGKAKADFFFVAYEKLEDVKPADKPHDSGGGRFKSVKPATARPDPATRPVTFVFNGGPGAASVWLHLGTAGPKRVELTDDGSAPPPPYRTVDNEFTWLDSTDLVFIDPVNTGFSRAAQGEDAKQFFGLEEDARAVANFIRLYTTRYERWGSPKFLAGESYGTTRAAKLSEVLLDAHGIALNGIVFISTVLDFQTIAFGAGNDLPYVTFLPTYTAIAGYHKRLAPDLQADAAKAQKESEAFAAGPYAGALVRGASLSADERADVIKQLARLTALAPELIDQADLRVDPTLFRKRLLGGGRQVIGRFDGRLVGFDADPLDRDTDFDPSLPQFLAAYSGAFNDYVRRGLGYQSDLNYEVLSGRVHPWNFGGGGWNGYPSVSRDLRSAMIKNPHLKVLFASGLYDLATPYMGKAYTVDHLDVGAPLRKNISMTFYPGGHMMYHCKPALEQLDQDVRRFIGSATTR